MVIKACSTFLCTSNTFVSKLWPLWNSFGVSQSKFHTHKLSAWNQTIPSSVLAFSSVNPAKWRATLELSLFNTAATLSGETTLRDCASRTHRSIAVLHDWVGGRDLGQTIYPSQARRGLEWDKYNLVSRFPAQCDWNAAKFWQLPW